MPRTRRHTGKKHRKTRTYTRKRPVMTGVISWKSVKAAVTGLKPNRNKKVNNLEQTIIINKPENYWAKMSNADLKVIKNKDPTQKIKIEAFIKNRQFAIPPPPIPSNHPESGSEKVIYANPFNTPNMVVEREREQEVKRNNAQYERGGKEAQQAQQRFFDNTINYEFPTETKNKPPPRKPAQPRSTQPPPRKPAPPPPRSTQPPPPPPPKGPPPQKPTFAPPPQPPSVIRAQT